MGRLDDLRRLVRELESALVAFSGGVDSTFLLWVARQELGDRVCAVTASSPVDPEREVEEARQLARKLGVEHFVIHFDPLLLPEYRANPPERCYYCKKLLYTKFWELAREKGLAWVIDGGNRDDEGDYRPGRRAGRELRVRSPLQEAGLSKEEIRLLSREAGLPTWDKPAAACLASRIPYGEEITREKLQRIERAEEFLHALGCRLVRVRSHGRLARIEGGAEEAPLIFRHRQEVSGFLKELGFLYVTLDLAGYRTGSMNEELPGAKKGALKQDFSV
ncbi:MAG: ATP-dependent sacrificial sulfur transferase LarE [Firmicutes bacterium]|nr:ATP-dependent sacrificial sulfur transferase LarE [Bacillota bacterium]